MIRWKSYTFEFVSENFEYQGPQRVFSKYPQPIWFNTMGDKILTRVSLTHIILGPNLICLAVSYALDGEWQTDRALRLRPNRYHDAHEAKQARLVCSLQLCSLSRSSDVEERKLTFRMCKWLLAKWQGSAWPCKCLGKIPCQWFGEERKGWMVVCGR